MATYGQLIEFGPYFDGGNQCTIQVYHYTAGTTTDKNVYIDRAKGTADAQPSVSDSNGICAFYADGLYKFRIDVSTDGVTYNTLYTYDDYFVGGQNATDTGEGTSIASASTLALGTDGDFFHVTGTTTITAISGSQDRVTLIFDDVMTLTNSGALILTGGSLNFTSLAGDSMELVNEGSGVWREVNRWQLYHDVSPMQGTLVASTSGATIDFSLPTQVKRFTVMLYGVSTSGTDSLLIQLGTASAFLAANYLGSSNAVTNGGATAGVTSTAGLHIRSASAANVISGAATFDLVDAASFFWVGRGTFAYSNAVTNVITACSVPLAAALTRVRITTTGGTDTFDLGSVNVTWE